MTKPKPIDYATTLVLPEDELAVRRQPSADATTTELQTLTVHELEEHLLNDIDETRTDVYPVPESGNPPK